MSRGGYHARARLESNHDEILIEALAAAESESIDVKNRAFREIARLARQCVDLLHHIVPPGPTPALAGGA